MRTHERFPINTNSMFFCFFPETIKAVHQDADGRLSDQVKKRQKIEKSTSY